MTDLDYWELAVVISVGVLFATLVLLIGLGVNRAMYLW